MLMVYCNKCFDAKSETQRKYVITGCFHIFCEGCFKNAKNFCLICKKSCKVLPINDHLPTEVKNYFDPKSIERMIHTIEKMAQFMDTQNKGYIAKNRCYRSNYYKYKKSILDMKQYSMKIDAGIAREKQNMEHLKKAYQTNMITPRLFQLRSSPLDNSEVTKSSGFVSSSGSQEGSPVSSLASSLKGFKSSVRSNDGSIKSGSQNQSALYQNARKSMLQSTLLNAQQQQQSQKNSQLNRRR